MFVERKLILCMTLKELMLLSWVWLGKYKVSISSDKVLLPYVDASSPEHLYGLLVGVTL